MTKYEEKLKALGIDRGRLEHGFGDDEVLNSRRGAVNYDTKIKLTAHSIGISLDDLSHLNPKISKGRSRIVSKWWQSMTPDQRAAMRAKRKEAFQNSK